MNCSTCSGTYILRRMGFDVEAKANIEENELNYKLSRGWNWDKWVNGFELRHSTFEWMAKNEYKRMSKGRYKNFLDEFTQEPGIYEWSVGWKGKGAGGHSTLIERTKRGGLLLIDQQNPMNIIRAKATFEDWLEDAILIPTRNRGIMRVDNAIFNPKYAKIVDRAAKTK